MHSTIRPRNRLRAVGTGALAVLALLLVAAPSQATSAPVSEDGSPAQLISPGPATGFVVASWWDDVTNFFVGSKERVTLIVTIVFIVGLFILFRARDNT